MADAGSNLGKLTPKYDFSQYRYREIASRSLTMILLDINGNHVLQHSSSQIFALVGHGTVLYGSGKDHHVSSFTFNLDGVGVEVLLVIGIGRSVVGVRTKSRASVFFGEVGQERDELGGQGGRRVHDVWVVGGIEGSVVGIVKMR